VDRIKRISFEVLDEHKSKFGEDFVENNDEMSFLLEDNTKRFLGI